VELNLKKYRTQCERMAPALNNRIKELNEDLSYIPYSKEDAPLDQTVE
jgi:hypothetical protein